MTDQRTYRTTYLGQFEHATAEKIAAALEDAGIGWFYKQTSGISRWLFSGEWGVRLFVAEDRVDEVRSIVAQVIADEGATS